MILEMLRMDDYGRHAMAMTKIGNVDGHNILRQCQSLDELGISHSIDMYMCKIV